MSFAGVAGSESSGEQAGDSGSSTKSTQQIIDDWRGDGDSDSSGGNSDVDKSANDNSTTSKKAPKKKAPSRYDEGLSDKSFGDALEKASAKMDRVCSGKGGAVNIYHESIKAVGFKFKARVSYQCKNEVSGTQEYGGYGHQKNDS